MRLPISRTHGDAAHSVEIHDQVSAALASLSPDHRATILLIDHEGLSYGEVASVMDITTGTVASRLSRARAAFKAALTQPQPQSETDR